MSKNVVYILAFSTIFSIVHIKKLTSTIVQEKIKEHNPHWPQIF